MSTPDKNLDYQQTLSVSEVHASVNREKDDPKSGFEPATISVFAICALFLMIGGAYLGANGGFNSSSVIPGYSPELPDGGGAGAVVDPRESWLKNGKKKFGTCAGCHMLNGLGKAGQYPPLAGSEWVTGGTERLAALILHGLTGPITVKGQNYSGAELMPAHAAVFSSAEIAQVMSYIRNNWGNEASFVTAEMIDTARDKFASQTTPYTNADLPAADANLPGELPEWAGGEPAAPAEPADAADAPAEPAGDATAE
ncbi:MAG: c-type cytochrome [Verrucomicrobiales bacterium]